MEQVAVVFAGLIMTGVTIRLAIDAVCEIVLAPVELQEPEMHQPVERMKAPAQERKTRAKFTGTYNEESGQIRW